MTRKTGTLHEDQYIFIITSRSVLLIMRNVSDKLVEKIKTQIIFSKKQAMWKNSVETDSPQMTKRRMRIPCWITEVIDTHLE
jgi:hypothetical protein